MTDDFIDLTPLFPLQEALDKQIEEDHGVDYPSTFERRVLALLVELGEFANETRCFKYWSFKAPSPKEKILDEYADGLHFLLSLGIPLGVSQYKHYFHVREKDLTLALHMVYKDVCELREHYDAEHYAKAFADYLNIIPLFDYSSNEVVEAYLKKLGTNHKRQEEKY
ncbi:MAG: dUTPase [Erysipelotrichaceae bacterium]|jgi:dimeric dUTPase (all-alpha-NTP-PPase superfamily)|nr:dUTPase [Erysipelotrichaceae bacterium]